MSERDSRLYLSDILDSGAAIQEFVKTCLLKSSVMTERHIRQ